MTLTEVPGVRVGHWTDAVGLTGVTVVSFPEPNIASGEVRGAAPGTREMALLSPGMRVEQIQAVALCGGSAFGLAAVDGVMRELEADHRGHRTSTGHIVPIVPAANLFDFLIGDPGARPGPAEGAAAYRALSSEPVEMGSVGAGTGAVVGGWRGREYLRKGGVGSSTIAVGGVIVGALVVVNAAGDVFTPEGEPLTGGHAIPPLVPRGLHAQEQTTLVVVATDAALDRSSLQRVNVRSHDALAVCLRPSHTRYDGDVIFSVACGQVQGDEDAIGEAAFLAVARAIEMAIRSSRSLGGLPDIEDGA